MARLLFHIGRFAARRPKTVIAAWFAVLLVAVAAVAVSDGELTSEITLPDMETLAVQERIADEIPGAEIAARDTGVVLVRTRDGEPFTDAQRTAVEQLSQRLDDHAPVAEVIDPFDVEAEFTSGEDELRRGREELEAAEGEIEARRGEGDAAVDELDVAELEIAAGRAELDRAAALIELSRSAVPVSEDGSAAVITVVFEGDLTSTSPEQLGEITGSIEGARIDGVEVLPGAGFEVDEPHLVSTAEIIGVAVAAVILLVMLGTLIGAGLPLLNALIGVSIGLLLTMSLAAFTEVLTITPTLGIMLGLAVGIDYALFILHRHRTQLKGGMGVGESIPLANGTAGNAVIFAGATVTIALLALNVTGLPFLGLMGTVAAISVAVAMLMAVTMTPAMLAVVGRRILRRRERTAAQDDARSGSGPSRTTVTQPMRTSRVIIIAVLSVIGLGVLALPTLDLRLGLPADSAHPEGTATFRAQQATSEAFGPGWNAQMVALADLPPGLSDEAGQVHQIDIAEELRNRDDISAVIPLAINDANTVALFHIIPEEGPTAEATEELAHEFLKGNPLAGGQFDHVELSVAGSAAASIEISDIIAEALPLYLTLVIGLSLVLMVMVFRSLLLPLTATLGFVGSLAGALGIVVAVFQWGWFNELFPLGDPGPVPTFLPVLMVGVLFGLAMDYQLFTATGMREAHVHGSSPRLAVRQGLHAGRAVVAAAALIMASVFGVFAFNTDPMVGPLGLGLATGVLLDAFVVRLLLVPALLHLAGPAAWWLPKWLDRILPDVDVEGAALERDQLEHAGSAVPHTQED